MACQFTKNILQLKCIWNFLWILIISSPFHEMFKITIPHNLISHKLQSPFKSPFNQPSISSRIWSKQHLMSQCVYFAFIDYCLFWAPFAQKKVFLKRNFQMKCFKALYIIFIVAPICHMFFYNQIWRNTNFWKCTNFVRFYVSSWKFIIISNHTKTC